jgi:hypothetical protein
MQGTTTPRSSAVQCSAVQCSAGDYYAEELVEKRRMHLFIASLFAVCLALANFSVCIWIRWDGEGMRMTMRMMMRMMMRKMIWRMMDIKKGISGDSIGQRKIRVDARLEA